VADRGQHGRTDEEDDVTATKESARPRRKRASTAAASTGLLSPEQIGEVLNLLPGADSVELKLSVPDGDRRSAVRSLAMDPLAAQIRQVMFFDTPDLALNRSGVVVRARRVQGKPADSVVKLRPVQPDQLAPDLRASRWFGVEVDAMPGGFVCSASFKAEHTDADVNAVFNGDRPVRKAFNKAQRAFFAAHAPGGLELDALHRLGPINVLKLKFTPKGFGRRLVAELWLYPDGARLLELSTKCPPAEAFTVAAEAKAFLAGHGVDLLAEQQTKTKSALEFFASELVGAAAG
jgi:hypothetical protein